jgi:hypothetical protein
MKNKWLILIALALIAIPVMAIASPASACVYGRSPGYWKNHPTAWEVYDPSGSDATHFSDVFTGVLPSGPKGYSSTDPTLMEILGNGGGGVYAFMRQAVCQLLNTTVGGSETGHTDWLISLVNDVLANPKGMITHSGDKFVMLTMNMEGWKNYLESFNI